MFHLRKFLLIFIIILLILFAGRVIFGRHEDDWVCENGQWIKHGNPYGPKPEKSCEQNLLGGDRDEHGCIGSAGYTWCEKKAKCLRIWEEKCE
jgi:hypothetical protein